MSYDEDWHVNSLDRNRDIVRKTIRPATVAELKDLGARRFSQSEDDMLLRYNAFLDQHPNAKYYHAELLNGAELAFCRDTTQGLWFLGGHGVGVIQPKGAKMIDEVIDAI